ncbi:hypothetical protein PQR75_40760 [Paraburkholderia fungorum]|uniref:hypothetical protein n=1 Tax=Paraburkholderia fungorum TaxID=134537 RepID=UPI0038B7D4E2
MTDPLSEDHSEIGALALVQLVKAIPGFKLVQMSFKEALLTLEVDATGEITPEQLGEDGLRALLVRGFAENILVVIRQYIPHPREVRERAVTAPDSANERWICVAGVGLLTGGGYVPMTADEAEENCRVQG